MSGRSSAAVAAVGATGRRLRPHTVLDGLLALGAVAAVLVELPPPVGELGIGYPVIGVVLCAAGPLAILAKGSTGRSPGAAGPFAGVVSSCLAVGVVVLLLLGWAAGRPLVPAQAATAAVVLLLTVVRMLLWALDGALPARPALRTRAWVRSLVPQDAGPTVVVDGQGETTWVSTAECRDGAPSPRDLTGRRTAELELERLAYTDYLTGLPNRARFMAELESAAARGAGGDPVCLLLVDLDGFKAVNDVAGHEAGDHLLGEIADLLGNGARDGDLVARLGGDEFALLVRARSGEATGLAELLVTLLDRSFRAPAPGGGALGPVFAVSGSIGVAELQPGEEASAAVRHADLALRAAKAAGKGCVRTSGQAIESAMGRRTRLARDLPAAMADGQLRLLYQPVVGVTDRRILGLEALVRWEHPLLGTVSPQEFIPLAEDDGLIVPLQQWVLRTALADAAELYRDGHQVQMAMNISVRHLQAGCLAPDVARALTASGVPAANLVLEITESVMLGSEDRIQDDLATLREMGCVLALDDFGQGWSSLAYLARLPVDILKMDREFVADIERDPRGAALVASVIELGRTLGMDVVAEGVETPGQAAMLQDMDCRYLQGYLFGRPLPISEIRTALNGFDATLLDHRRPMLLDALSTS